MGTDPRAKLDMLIADYQATKARLGAIGADLAGVTATAHSADRCVSVTVGPHGELIEITIDAGRAERLAVDVLAGRILQAAGLATARARERVLATVSAAVPDGMRRLLRPDGSVDLNCLVPDDPHEAAEPARLLRTR